MAMVVYRANVMGENASLSGAVNKSGSHSSPITPADGSKAVGGTGETP